ncbi:MAG: peroxide stress protein YaaA [Gammaproteobacteria bacterium]|nr:peroxide stress protein YaaA [Gammaproteobacteria bacterium]
MLMVISPAKTLDYETPVSTRKSTLPEFLPRSGQLIEDIRQLQPDDLRELMGISESLAELNHQRFMNWGEPFTRDNARQSVLAFKGDVYAGLDAASMNAADLNFAQRHLRILSGLYGVLRPLDLMQAYRLEMGLKFANSGGKNLYEFWGSDISDSIAAALKKNRSKVLVNLASNEYFKAVQSKRLEAEVITPLFKDLKNGKYRVVSFFAKKARGQMARYIIDQRMRDVVGIKKFNKDGYKYNKSVSTAYDWVFTRDP